ncbi:MAG TPA: Gfo/Idh/MocA family oxidoreductase [Opitutaceae bacterium]|nr:Gfo/Idh/MocA family oxidoreductase [Opitutaceae bacterium]
MPLETSRRDFLRVAAIGSLAIAGDGFVPSSAAAPAQHTAAPDRPLGIALLGLGNYAGGELAPALQLTKNCRLTGLISGHPAKAEQWARQYQVPKKNIYTYDTLEHIADNPDIDIVYVVTPPALHPEFVIRAAKAGKHVISEKPMATSVADCDAMIAACRDAKVRLSIGYRLHFDPYHTEMARRAVDPAYGPFTKMDGVFSFVMRTKVWRAEKRLAGGGPMMDLGIYVVHGACMAAGGVTPVAVLAHEEPKKRPDIFQDVEETMRWTMEFPGGAVATGRSSFEEGGNHFRAEGPHSWFELDNAFSYRGIRGNTSTGPLTFEPPVNQQARQMDDFADCIRTGRASPVPGELGRRDIRILMAIYESARTGKTVAV